MERIRYFITLYMLLAGVFAFSQTPPARPFESGFAGALIEGNMNTREGAAGGGGLLIGFDLGERFAFGVTAVYSNNFDTVSSLEPLAFFRWYPQNAPAWAPRGLFLQAETGVAIFFEYGDTFPAFSGGIRAGWRFYSTGNWFMETSLRFGYPYMWGAGVIAGHSFRMARQ